MKLIKLTKRNLTTASATHWQLGVKKSIHRCMRRPELCNNGVFHAYTSIEQAMLMKPVHLAYDDFRIFEAQGDPVVDDGTKCGCYELKLIIELARPSWYEDSRLFDELMYQMYDRVRDVERLMTVADTPYEVRNAVSKIQYLLNKYDPYETLSCKRTKASTVLRAFSVDIKTIDFPNLVATTLRRTKWQDRIHSTPYTTEHSPGF